MNEQIQAKSSWTRFAGSLGNADFYCTLDDQQKDKANEMAHELAWELFQKAAAEISEAEARVVKECTGFGDISVSR